LVGLLVLWLHLFHMQAVYQWLYLLVLLFEMFIKILICQYLHAKSKLDLQGNIQITLVTPWRNLKELP